jgi:hypothetical protein
MQRLSSNSTLFFKFFIPVFWIVFFGAFTGACLLYKFDYFGNVPANVFRTGVVLFYLTGVVVLGLTLMRLFRVEADEHFIFVTNYFKASRYPFHNIKKVQERYFLSLLLVSVYFKEPGQFGKRVTFIANKRLYNDFWDALPQLKDQLTEEVL